ncbi:hypothetical protein F0919_00730 [Taibaiella lutea]|uniref:Uncharacterized protein n=1 Tax=Taibaiella lutea TaxID=2608001 RepID=A0A5M6CME7_9BACT|nr:hypothetical protein [Taibaiella lutea]KAA5536223.1 hypothetical protein F0919_00730 [Taibaiella lutea]
MDNISEFFKEFKNRLNNPIFGSFIISWLIINWRIPIGLFGYRLSDLKLDGYNSYADLILRNASTWNYFWHPLIFAVLYTFLFPVFRMLIIAFLSYIKKKSNNWNTEIMKDYYVPMNRFVRQEQKYDDLARTLQQIYTEDSKTVEENVELKTHILKLNEDLVVEKNKLPQLRLEVEDMKSEHQRYVQFNNINCISGEWLFIRTNPNSESENEEEIKIMIIGSSISIMTPIDVILWGRILSFNYNSLRKDITIVWEYMDYHPLIDAHTLGKAAFLDVHILQLGYRGKTDVIRGMEGVDHLGNKVQYSRLLKESSRL